MNQFDVKTKQIIQRRRSSDFGARLTRCRKEAGYNQTEIAAMLGIKRTAVTSYESGKSKPPLEKFVSLCDILRTSPNELLGWKL